MDLFKTLVYVHREHSPIKAIRPTHDMRQCESNQYRFLGEKEVVCAGTIFVLRGPINQGESLMTDVPFEIVRGSILKEL